MSQKQCNYCTFVGGVVTVVVGAVAVGVALLLFLHVQAIYDAKILLHLLAGRIGVHAGTTKKRYFQYCFAH